MNRRAFFKLLATAAPAALAFPQIVRASTLGLGGGIAPSNRLNFGLIGAGGQGTIDMNAFLGLSDIQMIGVCDVDRARRVGAQKIVESKYANRQGVDKYQGCGSYLDYEELLARPDLDAVIVATPDHWHALPILAAARAGKHIFGEKPIANSIAECRAMVAAVERSGVVFQANNWQRSGAGFRRAIDLARGGHLGKIKRVMVGLPSGGPRPTLNDKPTPTPAAADFDFARWLGPAPYRPYREKSIHFHWRWSYDFGGGQLSDWICHHYDIAVLALGLQGEEVAAIRNASATFPDLPAELRATASDYSFEAVYPNGTVISVSSKNPSGVRIEGTDGWLSVTRGSSDCSAHLKRLIIPSDQQIFGTSTASHAQNMIDCIRTGAVTRSPIAEVSRVTTVAHLANAALRSGREAITWNATAGEITDAPDAQRFLAVTYRAPYVLQG